MNDEEIDQIINEIANKFLRRPLVDPQTGQMDLRYNQLCIDQDIFIATRVDELEEVEEVKKTIECIMWKYIN